MSDYIKVVHLANEGDTGRRIIGIKPPGGASVPGQYIFDLEGED